MEANLCKNQTLPDEDTTEKTPSLAMHVLSSNDSSLACTGDGIRVNFLYEIDNKKLPPKSPIQLKGIRVVMVTEKTELNVSVRFPSNLSLRKYFSSRINGIERHPELDEQFVMRTNLAKEILVRQISPPEFAKQRHLQSFWLVTPKAIEVCNSLSKEGSGDETGVKGICWSALKGVELHWGVRRRVTFMGKETEKSPRALSSSSLVIKVGKNEEEEEEATETDIEEKAEGKKKRKKRKHKSLRRNKKAIVEQSEEKKPNEGTKISSRQKLNKLKLSYNRWSKERYKSAEVKMLDILKGKGAVIDNPILRPALRLEARKHIGDTGLLDHLLKHMSGKVAPNGKDRFRRRHNADGAMEYWLESADLVNIRKKAGIKDPYWAPPAGWKPGDNPSQHPICARELKLLREEMSNIKKHVQELLVQNSADGDAGEVLTPTKSSNNLMLESDTTATLSMKEMYETLMKKKIQLEQQLVVISNSLNGMQEEMEKLITCSSVTEGTKSGDITADDGVLVVVEKEEGEGRNNKSQQERKNKEDQESAAAAEKAEEERAEKAEKRQRLRSGFRICKPQGTFLWPDMGVSAGSSSNNMLYSSSPSQVLHVQVEDMLMVPTPPSVSSATSAPPPLSRLLLTAPPPQPSSPVKPLAEKRAVSVALEGENITSGGIGGGALIYQQHHHYHHHHGFYGTPSSLSPHYRHHQQPSTPPFVLPTAVARGVGNETRLSSGSGVGTRRTYQRKQHKQSKCQNAVAAIGVNTWLALATPGPSSFANYE